LKQCKIIDVSPEIQTSQRTHRDKGDKESSLSMKK